MSTKPWEVVPPGEYWVRADGLTYAMTVTPLRSVVWTYHHVTADADLLHVLSHGVWRRINDEPEWPLGEESK